MDIKVRILDTKKSIKFLYIKKSIFLYQEIDFLLSKIEFFISRNGIN